MSINQRIADQDTILVMLEDNFFLQNYTTHAIRCRWHEAGIKLTDVLVSVRTERVALILVEAEVEFCTMLDDRTIERRQKNMVIIVELRNGNNQQTVVLTCVTVYKCRTAVGT